MKYIVIITHGAKQNLVYLSPVLDEVEAINEYNKRRQYAERGDVVRLYLMKKEFQDLTTKEESKYFHQASFIKELCNNYINGTLSENGFTQNILLYANGIRQEEDRSKRVTGKS